MEKKLNIAFITPRISGIGGAEKYVQEKILWLESKGHNCIIISGNHTNKESPYLDKLLEKKIKYYNLEWINEPNFLLNKRKLEKKLIELKKIMDFHKIDLIESNQIICGIYAYNLSIKYKIPTILNSLSELGFEKGNDYIKLLKKFEEYEQYYNLGSNSNKYIENITGMDLKKCKNIPIPVSWDKERMSVDKKFVLTITRFEGGKEYIFNLVEDFEMFIKENKKKYPQTLIIVGDGIYREKLEEKVKKINKKLGREVIVLTGFLTGNKLEELYNRCSVYVGMGTALLTAAAYKKPCIIATIDKKNDFKSIGYFQEDKENGYSFGQPFENSKFETYYYYLKKLYSERGLKEKIIENSSKFIESNFSIDSVMEKWLNEYKNILEKRIDLGNEYYIPKYSLKNNLKIRLKKIKIINFLLKIYRNNERNK